MLLICSAFDFTEQLVFTESNFSHLYCYFAVSTCHCTKPRLNFGWYQKNAYNFGKFVFLASPYQYSTIILTLMHAEYVTEVALWISQKVAWISTKFCKKYVLKFLQRCSKNIYRVASFYVGVCLLSDVTLYITYECEWMLNVNRPRLSLSDLVAQSAE